MTTTATAPVTASVTRPGAETLLPCYKMINDYSNQLRASAVLGSGPWVLTRPIPTAKYAPENMLTLFKSSCPLSAGFRVAWQLF